VCSVVCIGTWGTPSPRSLGVRKSDARDPYLLLYSV
jgi:hypothetical protein